MLKSLPRIVVDLVKTGEEAFAAQIEADEPLALAAAAAAAGEAAAAAVRHQRLAFRGDEAGS